jgi:hypothetical protein
MPPEILATIEALKAVRHPRFLATERGFHGAFYCALRESLIDLNMIDNARILEMEYQKSERHGVSQRPDIVFHIPVEVSYDSVRENNFAVWALKREPTETTAGEDFEKLDEMCCNLGYRLAIFVNVASTRTHLGSYSGDFHDRIHAFATPDGTGSIIRHEYFDGSNLREGGHAI